jgi:hypothetical protein
MFDNLICFELLIKMLPQQQLQLAFVFYYYKYDLFIEHNFFLPTNVLTPCM